jgi:hypothetical protein
LLRKLLEIDYSEDYNCDGNGRTNIMRTLTQLIALVGLDEKGLIMMMSSSVAGSLPLYSCSTGQLTLLLFTGIISPYFTLVFKKK